MWLAHCVPPLDKSAIGVSYRVLIMLRRFSCLLSVALLSAACSRQQGDTQAEAGDVVPPSTEGKLSFNTHVQPVLSEYCYHCHGPDSGTREPKSDPLRLDLAEFALAPRDGGNPVIIPGDPGNSLAVRLMRSRDPAEMMPPPEAHKEMPEEAIELLARWIAEGAEYEDHWAFVTPVRPEPPAAAHPEIVRNPVDAFIQQKLAAAGLEPMPTGGPRALARRAALDLTGLLPDPGAVEAFAADPSDEAYLAFLDSLFETTAYAEHRARYWLDYVRYADTHGLHFDNYRSIWPYRDYVIRSFAAHKPYDQFVREQLAGDLLAAPDADALIATGYLRSAVTTNEGGTIPEEVHNDRTRDRTEAFGATFIGLTVGCAACHDHKFDPVSAEEYYSLAAFFHNTADLAWDFNSAEPPPILRLPDDPERRAALDRAVASRSQAVAGLNDIRASAHQRFAAWLAAGNTPQTVSPDALELHLPLGEGSGDLVRNHAPAAAGPTEFKIETNPPVWGEYVWLHPSARMDIRSDFSIPGHGGFDTSDAFSVALWARPRVKVGGGNAAGRGIGDGTLIARMDAATGSRTGWDLSLEKGKVVAHLIHQWPDQAIRAEAGEIDLREWTHIGFTYDGSGTASGIRVFVDGHPRELSITHDTLTPGHSIANDLPLTLGSRHGGNRLSEVALQEVQLFRRQLTAGEIARLTLEQHVAKLLAESPDPAAWDAWQRHFALDRFFLATHDAEAAALQSDIGRIDREIVELGKKGTATLITHPRPEPPHAWTLARGEYANRETLVGADVPAILPPLPENPVRSRLDLAEWLFQPEHPLFARVTVNRIWQEIFGTALVDTPDDFGIMGGRPTHPELLDWLAVEFRESGWNLRHIYTLLLSSHTYRQSQQVTETAHAKDPDNILHSRAPRFRMDAEMLRDTALQASGLLVDRIGGPSVKPYQPDGIWDAVAMPESDTKKYQADSGENLYRRSLYTFWKRAAPPPSLETFDAESRETVCVGRARTNTPLQALVSMNDPQFFEAARLLGDRAIAYAAEPDARLQFIARTLLARELAPPELKTLRQRHASFHAHYSEHPDDARAVLTTGEHPPNPDVAPDEAATWTMLANLILNLDETLVK